MVKVRFGGFITGKWGLRMREEYYETLKGEFIPTGLPGGFFIYEAGNDEKIIYA